jgi:transcriptional regulator with XRE-family HTH domain
MFDTDRALADMADQIRAYRSADRLTLQQLATRSGVAASTIHKVESQQMVPTVSVLLKIARGLGRRPEELVRDQRPYGSHEDAGVGATEPGRGDRLGESVSRQPVAAGNPGSEDGGASLRRLDLGVWRVDLAVGQPLPPIDLGVAQRAIFLVERGTLRLLVDGQPLELDGGDCVELEGGRIEAPLGSNSGTRLTLIASPSGTLISSLGRPHLSSPARL